MLNFTEYSLRNTSGFISNLYLPCPNCDNKIYLKILDDTPEPHKDTTNPLKHPNLKYLALACATTLVTPCIIYIILKHRSS